MSGDLTISGTVHIKGSCVFNGATNNLIMGPDGHIIVDRNIATLFNLTVEKVIAQSIQCQDDSAPTCS